MNRLRISAVLVVAFAVSVALGQQQDQKPTGGKPADGVQEGMMTKPMAELHKFSAKVLGKWNVQESHPASEMGPAGSSSGRAEFRKGPGGMSVIEHIRMSGQPPFEGLGVFWWDPKEQAYKGLWCDSMTPTCDTGSVGHWEGDNLVVHDTIQMPDGKTLQTKDVYSEITPNSFTFTMYGGPDENSMQKLMTIKYTRESGPPAAKKPNTKM